MIKAITKQIQRLPIEAKHILLLFFVTRLVLTIVGVISRIVVNKVYPYLPEWTVSKHLWLDIWSILDSNFFIRIAELGYPSDPSSSLYGFFPLYSWLTRGLTVITQNSYLAALLLSNVCLICSCFLLYNLVKIDSSKKNALLSVKYLFLFPGTFIFSAVYSESLFLCLMLLCFYYARKEKWLAAGVVGFFISLTRPQGMFLLFPILFEYAQSKEYLLKRFDFRSVYLLLFPLGIVAFFIFCFWKTGGFFAYISVKSSVWSLEPTNPIKSFIVGVMSSDIRLKVQAFYALFLLGLLVLHYRKMRISYLLMGIIFIVLPLCSFEDVHFFSGMIRHASYLFPFYMLLARYCGKNNRVDKVFESILSIIQVLLMSIWCTGWYRIIG